MTKHSLEDFKQHLIASGKLKSTVETYISAVRRFLKHVGNERLDRISVEIVRSFFAKIDNHHTRSAHVMVVSQFLHFAHARLPVVIAARREQSPRAPPKKELALRRQWS